MVTTTYDIMELIERTAPLALQETYDNAGLQVGNPNKEVGSVMVCLDVTEDVIEEACRKGCDLIVSHHPLIFQPLRHLTGSSHEERCAMLALKLGIGIYAAHTNLDNAENGVNHKIADMIGLTQLEWLNERPFTAGCACGEGLVGMLEKAEDEEMFLQRMKQTFDVECLMHNRLHGRPVRRVALCGGSGAFLLPRAIEKDADVFITGELSYHHYFGHDNDLLLIALGHYQSEQFTKDVLARLLAAHFPQLNVLTTTINTNPIEYLV